MCALSGRRLARLGGEGGRGAGQHGGGSRGGGEGGLGSDTVSLGPELPEVEAPAGRRVLRSVALSVASPLLSKSTGLACSKSSWG